MAISPLSVYFNWCNPDGSFFGGGLAYIYIYIVLYLKKVGPGGAEHIYIYNPQEGSIYIYIYRVSKRYILLIGWIYTYMYIPPTTLYDEVLLCRLPPDFWTCLKYNKSQISSGRAQKMLETNQIPSLKLTHHVDGPEFPRPTTFWIVLKPCFLMRINYQPQLVSRISEPSTIFAENSEKFPTGNFIWTNHWTIDDCRGDELLKLWEYLYPKYCPWRWYCLTYINDVCSW